jgi:WD40 repeat protein
MMWSMVKGSSWFACALNWDDASNGLYTLRGHTGWVESVAFSPDGEWIASASLDGAVKIWKTPPLPEPTAGAER